MSPSGRTGTASAARSPARGSRNAASPAIAPAATTRAPGKNGKRSATPTANAGGEHRARRPLEDALQRGGRPAAPVTAGLAQACPQLSGEDARVGAPARVDGEGTIDGVDEAAR